MKRFLLLVGSLSLISTLAMAENYVKEPVVSGQFYAADPVELGRNLDQMLANAPATSVPGKISILLAPHAGYLYSGPVAAAGYQPLKGKNFKTIVILAPSHFVPFDGVSVWPQGAFKTPLGSIAVDAEFARQLIEAHPKFQFYRPAYAREHSLEVQLPFLQKTFSHFKIVPVVLGMPSREVIQALAAALNKIIGARDDVLIVVSTDLSHYHPDRVAREMDLKALALIEEMNVEGLWQKHDAGQIEMCGFFPVVAGLEYARLRQDEQVKILRYGHSGEVTRDKSSVVGYGAVLFFRKSQMQSAVATAPGSRTLPLTLNEKKRLLEMARQTLQEYLTSGQTLHFKDLPPRLLEKEGAFVTLRFKGQLRGCIGHITADQPLSQTVRDMAIAAAVQDSRFTPVKREELKDIEIEISVLSRPWVVKNLDTFKIGEHGAIVSQGPFRRGLFLPQVAVEFGWNKEQFFSNLCTHKAGLPADAWKDPRTKIELFSSQVFSESEVLREEKKMPPS